MGRTRVADESAQRPHVVDRQEGLARANSVYLLALRPDRDVLVVRHARSDDVYRQSVFTAAWLIAASPEVSAHVACANP